MEEGGGEESRDGERVREMLHCWLLRQRKGPWAKECGAPSSWKRQKETDSPQSLQGEPALLRDLCHTSDLQTL